MTNEMNGVRNRQQGESFVLVGEEPISFRYNLCTDTTIVVRNKFDAMIDGIIVYEEGRDYVIDDQQHTIRRTSNSRIGNGALHPMYGMTRFDHQNFQAYSNEPYTVYVDYETNSPLLTLSDLTVASVQNSGYLSRICSKLAAGDEVVYVVYGDSISAGGEASDDQLTYYSLFANKLRALYPLGSIRLINLAIGGESSQGGVERFEQQVIALQPDLISIGYGMNDQNHDGNGLTVPPDQFHANIQYMIETLSDKVGSDVLLVTPCEPNLHWCHTSGKIDRYAEVLQDLGRRYQIGVADVHPLWVAERQAGKTSESLLLNNINHPNDYGHQLYSHAFSYMFRSQ